MNQTAVGTSTPVSTATTPSTPTTSTAAPVSSTGRHDGPARALRPPGLDAVLPAVQQVSLTVADDAAAAGMRPAYVAAQLKSGELKFAIEDPGARELPAHPVALARQPLRLLRQGQQYFLKHLLGTDNAVKATGGPRSTVPRGSWAGEGGRGQTRPAPVARLPDDEFDALLRCRPARGDVVREARHQHHGHAPFVHSFNPAIAPPWQSKTDWETWKGIAKRFSELAKKDRLGVRAGRRRQTALARHPDAMATVHGASSTGARVSASRCPARPFRPRRGGTRLRAIYDKMIAIGPLMEKVGMLTRAWPTTSNADGSVARALARATGVAASQPRWRPTSRSPRRSCTSPAPAMGTSVRPTASSSSRSAPADELHDLSAEHEGKQITFADTQVRRCRSSPPRWSGSETGGRRYSPSRSTSSALKPFHTLTGRQQFYLDHDWMIGMGEAMPVYRPPLNMTKLFGESPVGTQPNSASRPLPDAAQPSGRSTVVSGQPVHARSRGGRRSGCPSRRRQDRHQGQRLDRWPSNRNGRRRPADRQPPDAGGHGLHAPRAGPAGRRASPRPTASAAASTTPSRILVKPSHIIGGYAQLAYFFNYIGPTGKSTATRSRRSANADCGRWSTGS